MKTMKNTTPYLGVKLVLNTQYMENYGDRWKAKGGSTYVVTDKSLLSSPESLDEIRSLIEHSNDHSSEFVRGEEIVSRDATVCEDWETLNEVYRAEDGTYRVKSVAPNNDHGAMRHQIAFKTVDKPLGSERGDFSVEYELTNGRTAHNDAELRAELINMGVKF
tara:strand:+ start:1056 stop:1544 length:489 start_codon:yes stop_codon:yes gene_type:complete